MVELRRPPEAAKRSTNRIILGCKRLGAVLVEATGGTASFT
jgi:hypothetical protein